MELSKLDDLLAWMKLNGVSHAAVGDFELTLSSDWLAMHDALADIEEDEAAEEQEEEYTPQASAPHVLGGFRIPPLRRTVR